MKDLSVIIPGKNEEFFNQTIDNVLKQKRGDTEVIAIIDGYDPDPPIHERDGLIIVHKKDGIGQRGGMNLGAEISTAKYIMKLDAHCAVDEGFDIKLMENMQYDWTVIPLMYNLHAFDWKCNVCGKRTMQGPPIVKCEKCSAANQKWFEKVIVWEPKWRKGWHPMRFDSDLKFQYWYDYKKRMVWEDDIADLMCAIGACWFQDRKRFLELGGLDERHGSWGQVGVEVACKAWLSGGRHVQNRKTWFSHMFRTNNKGFSFPYEISGRDVHRARKHSQWLWKKGNWNKAVRKLDWIIDKFHPVPGWENHKPEKKAEKKLIKNLTESKGETGQGDFKYDLSVIIPARNEKYLQKTIEDIFENFETNYEIIVGLDNYEPNPPLKEDKRISIIKFDKRVGMRHLINATAAKARGKYIMKTDAHCNFDKGYDRKLIEIYEPGATVLGVRYELDVDNWCRKARTNCDFRYLSPPDDPLGGLRGLPWHEQKKLWNKKSVAESMSLSGSGWLMEKAQFDKWSGLDENHGTMYQEGCEIACKTWLSGGRLLINRNTWYGHWNRGKAPYALAKKQRTKSINYALDYWLNNRWPLQTKTFQWLIEKFNPPGWNLDTESVNKELLDGTTILYYSRKKLLPEEFSDAIKHNLYAAAGDRLIIWQIQKESITPSYHSILKNIWRGLKKVETKYVAFCEHDVLYSATHFDRIPEHDVEYNRNRYRLLADKAVYCKRPGPAFSSMIAKTNVILHHIQERLARPDTYPPQSKRWEPEGDEDTIFNLRKVDVGYWESPNPIVDIVNHGYNLTKIKEVKNPQDHLKSWGLARDVIENYNVPTLSKTPYREIEKIWQINYPDKKRYIRSPKFAAPNWKGKSYRVKDMWLRRHFIYDHNKRQRGALFYDTFLEFVNEVLAGKTSYTNIEMRDLRYYRYLRTHTVPSMKNVHRHIKIHIKNSIKLIQSISENGMYRPIECYRTEDGRLIIYKGYRRFVIAYALGHDRIVTRVSAKEELARKLPSLSEKEIIPGTINELGRNQFVKHGIYATDKYYTHDYLDMYDKIFGHLRNKKIKILEIGLLRGASLALWHEAFPKAQIYGFDRTEEWKKMAGKLDRLTVFKGQQEDAEIMQKVASNGPYDIIIDDCGHRPDSQWTSFCILWPAVKESGYYIVEDCSTSFKKNYDGFNLPMEFAGWVRSIYMDQEVFSLNFYYNMCCVQKGIKNGS